MVNGSLNECIRRYFFPVSSQRNKKKQKKKTPDLRLLTYRFSYSWLASTWHGGHVGGQYNKNYLFSKIYMKMEFSFQRIEIFGFLTTDIASMTSRANQQYSSTHINCNWPILTGFAMKVKCISQTVCSVSVRKIGFFLMQKPLTFYKLNFLFL